MKGGKLESCKQKIVLPFISQDAARRRDRRRPGLQRLGALLVASPYCPHVYMPVGCWNRGFGAVFVRDGAVTHARPFGVGRGRRGILFQRSSSRGTFIAEHAFDPFADG